MFGVDAAWRSVYIDESSRPDRRWECFKLAKKQRGQKVKTSDKQRAREESVSELRLARLMSASECECEDGFCAGLML